MIVSISMDRHKVWSGEMSNPWHGRHAGSSPEREDLDGGSFLIFNMDAVISGPEAVVVNVTPGPSI